MSTGFGTAGIEVMLSTGLHQTLGHWRGCRVVIPLCLKFTNWPYIRSSRHSHVSGPPDAVLFDYIIHYLF